MRRETNTLGRDMRTGGLENGGRGWGEGSGWTARVTRCLMGCRHREPRGDRGRHPDAPAFIWRTRDVRFIRRVVVAGCVRGPAEGEGEAEGTLRRSEEGTEEARRQVAAGEGPQRRQGR